MLVFRFDEDLRFLLRADVSVVRVTPAWRSSGQEFRDKPGQMCEATYIGWPARTEARPSIEPVIIFELIDLHTLLLVCGWYHQRHGREATLLATV